MLKHFFFLLILIIPLVSKGFSHWNEEQVTKYVHHSELQRRCTWQLLSQIQFRGDETILDIGCGDGRNAAWMACLVRKGNVIGLDPCYPMIDWAKRQYHPMEFPNLSFEIGDFGSIDNANISPESCDMITSFFSLHLEKDKSQALDNIYAFLKPKGKFICTVPPPLHVNVEYAQAIKKVILSPKWKDYFVNFALTFQLMDLEEYKWAMAKAGLTLIEGKHQLAVNPFVNAQEYVDWFKGTMPHVHYLPENKQDEFIQDILDSYLNLRPDAVTDDGTLYFYWGHFEFIAYKN